MVLQGIALQLKQLFSLVSKIEFMYGVAFVKTAAFIRRLFTSMHLLVFVTPMVNNSS